jgi:hypothetical protein
MTRLHHPAVMEFRTAYSISWSLLSFASACTTTKLPNVFLSPTTMTQVQKHPKKVNELPPTIGMAGSIAFFVTLFSLANPNKEGYAQFRECHGNCVNGVLHAIGMPLAVSGVFLVVRSVSDGPQFTRHLQFCVVTAYLYLYLQYEVNQWSPWLFYVIYMSVFDGFLYQKLYKNPAWTRLKYLVVGAALIVFNVGALETIGHGLFEHHHSNVLEFFNSVFHTPLYGINSVLGLFVPRAEHGCW